MKTILAIAATLAASLAVSNAQVVTLPHGGKLKGIRNPGFDEYHGVPFAQPPVNELRWKSPQPPSSWSGTRDATKWGNSCAQFDPNAEYPNNFPLYTTLGDLISPDPAKAPSSEDCLYLNVYVPRGGKAKKPVVMFLHGGGLVFGGAGQPVLDGKFLASSTKDAIIVTPNHRLGIFGYSGSAELAADNTDGSTSNYGWLDQTAALKWIQDNIHSFGGDPERVTLWGQSAGAQSVLWHLIYTNERSEAAGDGKLFQQVIMDSPNPSLKPFGMATAQLRFDNLVTAFNCTGTGAQKIACLRGKSTQELNTYQKDLWTQLYRANGAGAWAMAVDGVAIPTNAWVKFLNGEYDQDVKIIIGNDANEGTGFIRADELAPTFNDFVSQRFGWVTPTYRQQIVDQIYPSSNFTLHEQKVNVYGDLLFTCPDRYLARKWASTNPKVWYYRFSLSASASEGTPLLGSPHASELIYFWRHLPAMQRIDEYVTSWRMSKAITNFIASGDPNQGGNALGQILDDILDLVPASLLSKKITWPAYTGQGGSMIDFGSSVVVKTDANANCDFFDQMYNALLP